MSQGGVYLSGSGAPEGVTTSTRPPASMVGDGDGQHDAPARTAKGSSYTIGVSPRFEGCVERLNNHFVSMLPVLVEESNFADW